MGYIAKKNERNLKMLFFKNKTIVMLPNNVKLSSNLMQKFEPTILSLQLKSN